jgi:hypothetical protein
VSELTVDRGDPFGLLGYDLPPAKIRKSKAGVLSGLVLDLCSY